MWTYFVYGHVYDDIIPAKCEDLSCCHQLLTRLHCSQACVPYHPTWRTAIYLSQNFSSFNVTNKTKTFYFDVKFKILFFLYRFRIVVIRDLTILGRQRDDDGQNKHLQINGGNKDNLSYVINHMNLVQS
jgi:hypothetical protein